MKNKGFSLVELIIVIAIMAILAAAIAPALIRYIDKSRKADDVTAAGTINSAVSAALANEDAYDVMQGLRSTAIVKISKGSLVKAYSGDNALLDEISNNLDQKVAPKYKKESQAEFVVWADANGKVTVAVQTAGATGAPNADWQMQPSIGRSYK
jgi:prepilin-type N-terminal cleavage/methylation domain